MLYGVSLYATVRAMGIFAMLMLPGFFLLLIIFKFLEVNPHLLFQVLFWLAMSIWIGSHAWVICVSLGRTTETTHGANEDRMRQGD